MMDDGSEQLDRLAGALESLGCLERHHPKARNEEDGHAPGDRTPDNASSWPGLALLVAVCAAAQKQADGGALHCAHNV